MADIPGIFDRAPMFHGTAAAWAGDTPGAATVGKARQNLYGPGLYMTGHRGIAGEYVAKEHGTSPTVYGLGWRKKPNLINLDKPLPSDVHDLFAPFFGTEASLLPHMSGTQLYNRALDLGDEQSLSLIQGLRGRGYHGFIHTGGHIVGGGESHRVTIAFAPDVDLKVLGKASAYDPQSDREALSSIRETLERERKRKIDPLDIDEEEGQTFEVLEGRRQQRIGSYENELAEVEERMRQRTREKIYPNIAHQREVRAARQRVRLPGKDVTDQFLMSGEEGGPNLTARVMSQGLQIDPRIDPNTAGKLTAHIEKVLSDYPEIAGSLKGINLFQSSGIGVSGQYLPQHNVINMDVAQGLRRLKMESQGRVALPGAARTLDDIFTHEFGHAVQGELNAILGGSSAGQLPLQVRRRITRAFGMDSFDVKAIGQAIGSPYGGQNQAELFAEMFTMHYKGVAPEPVRAVMEGVEAALRNEPMPPLASPVVTQMPRRALPVVAKNMDQTNLYEGMEAVANLPNRGNWRRPPRIPALEDIPVPKSFQKDLPDMVHQLSLPSPIRQGQQRLFALPRASIGAPQMAGAKESERLAQSVMTNVSGQLELPFRDAVSTKALKGASSVADWMIGHPWKASGIVGGLIGGTVLYKKLRERHSRRAFIKSMGAGGGPLPLGSLAGLEDSPTASVMMAGSGYDNPMKQNARYGVEMGGPNASPLPTMSRPVGSLGYNQVNDSRGPRNMNTDREMARMI